MLMLPETLTEAEAEDVLRLARQALKRSPAEEALRVDASALGRYDSSALAVLLETQRLARAWGRDCTVAGLPAPLVELARLYGIDGLLALAAGPVVTGLEPGTA
ncbi:STAS domain-containing protein [Piscinibacter sp. SJAQ100]|uniref:STAS domain-containing protein n=1 Tax=Aquariibacter albus TaxID=2759899 RepID=A0A839HL53_9BURK|nr:STAS domain-containing protein [Aquariibacter albus]